MYDKYYGLEGKPFQLNPDPTFFYQSKGHRRAMAYLRYGLQQGQGFIIVTGDVGTGKTMLLNNLFRELESKDIVAAKIVSSNVRENDLLRLIASSLGLEYENASKAALLTNLEAHFRACKDEGKRVLLLVDEVQNLPRDSLEELRMLSNFDYNGEPLVQSFLLGQREFRTVMRAPGLEQLRQRVLAAYHLKPLSSAEVETYIKHRLSKVGWKDNPAIDEDVYFSVYRFTNGVPRRINTLFDRVLLNACLEESKRITVTDVETVAAEIEDERADNIDGKEQSAEKKAGGPAAPAQDKQQEADKVDTLAEMRRMAARMEAMQRTIDTLSTSLTQAQNTEPPKFWGSQREPVRTKVLMALVGVGIGAIGLAGAVVYKLLT